MPSSTPEPPPPWENGWLPDSSRAPGTRRLWLAGTLALATVVACVTAIALDDGHSATASPSARSPSDSVDDGPGLLSFPSSPTATGSGRHNRSRPDSGTPASGDTGAGKSGGKSAPSPSASSTKADGNKSGGDKGSSGGGSGSGSTPASVWKSVRSVNYPDRYWHISGDLVKLDPVGSADARSAATFKLVKGLADKACYSFATADGGYLRHRDFVLRSEHDDGSALFEKDATFCPRASAYSGAVMLESVNYPGRYLRHQNFQLKLDPYQGSDLYRADSAFRLTDGPA